MDLDGIDAAFLYPTVGLFSGAVREPHLAAAMCRAYNRWLADYCRPYPDRLFGVAMLPMQSIELAIEEMRYARRELGMRAASSAQSLQRPELHHPDYAPFWAEVQELDFAIGLHEGASGGMPQVGVDRFETRGARHIISHTMEMMLAAMSVIWSGVCDRFPRVRIGFMESGGGWIAPWLDRMDRHFDDQGFNNSGLSMRPSELFQRNCWISFEPVEGCLGVLAEYIGPHKILWATDYPHPDGFFPGAPQMISGRPELSDGGKRETIGGGVKRFTASRSARSREGGETMATSDRAPVVDADGHVLEPADTWLKYLEPAYRDSGHPHRPGPAGLRGAAHRRPAAQDVARPDGRPRRHRDGHHEAAHPRRDDLRRGQSGRRL